MIRLNKPFKYGTVKVININKKYRNEDLLGKDVSLSGWGVAEDIKYPNNLREIDVNVIDRKFFKGHKLSSTNLLTFSRGRGIGSCNGDSGGKNTSI